MLRIVIVLMLFCCPLVCRSVFAQTALPASAAQGQGGIDGLSVRDRDVREVIELIARKGGLNIVTGPGISGKVTIFLSQVDAREALRIVLESNGLAYSEDNGILRIMTAEEFVARYGYAFGKNTVTRVIGLHFKPAEDIARLLEDMKSPRGRVIVNASAQNLVIVDEPDRIRLMEEVVREMDVQIVSSVFPLKYARAEAVLEKVRGMVTRSAGSVQCDIPGNRLLVSDTPSNIEKIRRAVEQMDASGRRVLLQAKLVHIALDDEHLHGVDWAGILEDHRNVRLRGNYDFLEGDSQEKILSLGVIADSDFETLLEALETVGDVREYPLADIVLDQPDNARITVHFNEPAIDLGRIPAGADGLQPLNGTSLDFDLQTTVDPLGVIGARIILPDPVREQIPFSRASVGFLEFNEGNTVVLGGLIASEKIAVVRKIPVMGDIPLLGFAFRYRNNSIRREEFVIFLTPKVSAGEDRPAGPVLSEKTADGPGTGLPAQEGKAQ